MSYEAKAGKNLLKNSYVSGLKFSGVLESSRQGHLCSSSRSSTLNWLGLRIQLNTNIMSKTKKPVEITVLRDMDLAFERRLNTCLSGGTSV